MKRIQLRSWVKTVLITWVGIDFMLVSLALYMTRLFELGL